MTGRAFILDVAASGGQEGRSHRTSNRQGGRMTRKDVNASGCQKGAL